MTNNEKIQELCDEIRDRLDEEMGVSPEDVSHTIRAIGEIHRLAGEAPEPTVVEPITPGPTRRFQSCSVCGVPEVDAVYVEAEVKEVPDPQRGMTTTSFVPTIEAGLLKWHNTPPGPTAERGFYVRCKRCAYAWYEALEDRSPEETGS